MSIISRVTLPFRKFHSWLFSSGSPEVLSALRVIFGLLAFAVLLMQLPFLESYYGKESLLPPEALRLWQWRGWTFNPLINLSSFEFLVFYIALLLSCLFMAAGLFSRFFTWVVFLGLLAVHNNNPLILNSGDTLLRAVIFYLALGKSGATFSVDAFLRKRRGNTASTETIPLFPQRLIQLQIAIVYFTAVWHKVQGPLWRDGTSTWYISRLEELSRFPLPDLLLTEWAAYGATWGTLLVQLSICTLVWFKPYRKWVLLAGVLMHLSMEYQFNIPFFSLITVACYLSFYEGRELKCTLSSFVGRHPAASPHIS